MTTIKGYKPVPGLVASPIDFDWSPWTEAQPVDRNSIFLAGLPQGLRQDQTPVQAAVDALSAKQGFEQYRALGMVLNADATVTVNGTTVTKEGALTEALAKAPKNAKVWQLWRNLGLALLSKAPLAEDAVPLIKGRRIFAKDAFVEALTAEPNDAVSWVGLAMSMTDGFDSAVVSGLRMRRIDCMEKSVALQRFRVGPATVE
jgi:hypothetical protein